MESLCVGLQGIVGSQVQGTFAGVGKELFRCCGSSLCLLRNPTLPSCQAVGTIRTPSVVLAGGAHLELPEAQVPFFL